MQHTDLAATFSRPSIDDYGSAWILTGRPSFSLRRRKSNDHSQRRFSRSRSNAPLMSPEAYEALPLSIKKKYFSSAERLQIVQQTSAERRRKHSLGSASWKSASTSTDHDIRPSTSSGISLRKRRSHHQSKEAMSAVTGFDMDNISEEQALWFVNLPDKIRKQQFSRKEQISLAVQSKRALQHTSPESAEDILRRCLYAGREADITTTASRPRRRSSATIDTDILIDEDYMDGETLLEYGNDYLTPVMDIHNHYSRAHNGKTRSDIVVPPLPVIPLNELRLPEQPRRSFSSRSITLMPISLPPPQLSPIPPVPPLPSTDHIRPRALNGGCSQPLLTGPTPPSQEATTEVKHYQQPDVRKQLRQYLQPHKFDEALEFGFALSNDDDDDEMLPSLPRRPPPLPPGLSDDEYGDEESDTSPETLSPRTPTTVSDGPHPAIRKLSFDSGVEIRPSFFSALKPTKIRSPDGSLGNREMTIHMTLTRRDLRAPEEDAYGVQRPQTSGVDVERVDPLSLDPLLICDDPSGAQGAFAVGNAKGNALRKVWKSLRRH